MLKNLIRKIRNILQRLGEIFPPDEKFSAICDYYGKTGLLQKFRDSRKDWIPFNKLVNPDKSFQPCPNCGKKSVGTPTFGGIFPIHCDPKCESCGYRFKPQNWWWIFSKGFRVMSSQAYDALSE